MAWGLGALLMVLSLLVAGPPATAQEKTLMPNLKALADGKAGSIRADATLGLLSEEGDLCREGRLVLRHKRSVHRLHSRQFWSGSEQLAGRARRYPQTKDEA
jgi:hypothetical protein